MSGEVVGSAVLELVLGTQKFDRRLQQLRQQQLPDLSVKLALDTVDLNRQLGALRTQIKPIKVDLAPDVEDFQRKLDKIARSQIKPIKITFDIDDSSIKKIEAINAATIAPKVDHTNLTELNKHLDKKLQHLKEVQKYFDANPLTVKTVTQRLDKDNFLGKEDDLSKSITKAIEKGFNSVKPKTNLVGTLLAPLATIGHIIAPVFSGVVIGLGLPLGQKLGAGIEQGLEGQFSNIIGSFELLGREGTAVATSVGGAIAKELLGSFSTKIESAQSVVAKSLKQVLGEENVVRESQNFRNERSVSIEQKQSGATKSIGNQLRAAKDELAIISQEQKDLEAARTEIAKRREKLTQTVQRIDALPANVRKESVNEIRETLKSVKQENAALEDLEASLLEREVELNTLVGGFQKTISGLRKQLNTIGVTPESDDALFNIGITQKPAKRKELLRETTVQTVSEKNNKLANIQEGLNKKVSNTLAFAKDLGGNQDTSEVQLAFEEFNKKILNITKSVKKASLLPNQELLKLEDELDSALALASNVLKMTGELQKKVTDRAGQAGNFKVDAAKSTYEQAIKVAAQQLTGKPIQSSNVPGLQTRDTVGADYNSIKNSIGLNPGSYEALAQKVTKENIAQFEESIEYIVHEFTHALQSEFGKIDPSVAGAKQGLNIPQVSEKELQDLAPRIEGSTKVIEQFNPELATRARETEKQAYLAQVTVGRDVAKQLSKQKAIAQVESVAGVAGINAKELTQKLTLKLTSYQKLAQEVGVNIERELKPLFNNQQALESQANELIQKASNLELLPTEEILELEQHFSRLFSATEQQIEETASLLEVIKQKRDAPPPTLFNKAANAGGELVANAASWVDGKATQFVNGALMHVPGQAGTLDLSRQITSLKDLRPTDLARLAMHSVYGTGSALSAAGGAILPTAKGAYDLAKGLESVALTLIPFGNSIKTITQNVLLPAAGTVAATHFIPGASEAVGLLGSGAQHLLEPALSGVAGTAANSLSGLASQTFSTIPLIGDKIAGALGGSATQLLGGAAEGIAQAVAGGLSILLPGKVAQNVLLASGKKVAGALPGGSDRPLLAPAPVNIQPVPKAELVGVEIGNALLDASHKASKVISNTANNIQKEIAPAQKVSVQALSGSAPLQLGSVKNSAIVRSPKNLSETVSFSLQDIKNELATDTPSVDFAKQKAAQIRQGFSSLAQPLSKEINKGAKKRDYDLIRKNAAEIIDVYRQAYAEIDTITKKLKSETRYAGGGFNEIGGDLEGLKGQLTTWKKSAEKALQKASKSLGYDIASGLEQGVNLKRIEQSGHDLGSAIIHGVEDTLEIHSPSRKFIAIGKQIIEGLKLGLAGIGNAFNPAQKEISEAVSSVYTKSNITNPKLSVPPANRDLYVQAELTRLENEVNKGIKNSVQGSIKATEEQLKASVNRVSGSGLTAEQARKLLQLQAEVNSSAEQAKAIAKYSKPRTAAERLGNYQKTKVSEESRLLSGEAANTVGKLESRFLDPNSSFDEGTTLVVAQQIGKAKAAINAINEINSKEVLNNNDLSNLKTLNKSLKEFFESVGQEAPKLDGFGGKLASLAGIGSKLLPTIGNLVKGFLAFQALSFLQNTLSGFAKGAFDTFVKFDNLRTALKFATGGASQGAAAFKFVNEQVDKLGVPLEAAVRGYTKLATATKGTTLEGQATKDAFIGVSQAATVLGLSADDTNGALLALTQIASKGKVQAEELRGQLGERLPGAFSIAAKSIGVTESELNKMLESGEVLASDFLPKFGKALQKQFGEESKNAATNAQSAIFALENAFVSLQDKIGQTVAPATVGGINLLTGAMKFLADNGASVAISVGAVAGVIAIKLLPVVADAIKSLYIANTALPLTVGGFKALGIAAAGFAVQAGLLYGLAEVIRGIAEAVDSDLAKSFKNAAKSANDAAEAIKKARNPEKPPTKGNELETVNWLDDFERRQSNLPITSQVGFGIPKLIFRMFSGNRNLAEIRRDDILKNINNQAGGIDKLLGEAGIDFDSFNVNKVGDFKSVDGQLKDTESQRRALKNELERNYTRRGLLIPLERQKQLEAINVKANDLTKQRGDILEPLTRDSALIDKQIDEVKSKLESLKDPSIVKALGRDPQKERDVLQQRLDQLKDFKSKIDSVLTSIDPTTQLIRGFEELKLQIEAAERATKQFITAQKLINTNEQLAGFGKDYFASEKASVKNATTERDAAKRELEDADKAIASLKSQLNGSDASRILGEYNLSADSSIQDIDRATLQLGDDTKGKEILKQLKSLREEEDKLGEKRVASAEKELALVQAIEQQRLAVIAKGTADAEASTKLESNNRLLTVKTFLKDRAISEEQGAIDIAKVQLDIAQSNIDNVKTEQYEIDKAYGEGVLSFKTYTDKKRELELKASDLSVQLAEQQIALEESKRKAILATFDLEKQRFEFRENQFFSKERQKVLSDKDLGRIGDRTADKKLASLEYSEVYSQLQQNQFALNQLQEAETQKLKPARDIEIERMNLLKTRSQLQESLINKQINFTDKERADANEYYGIQIRNLQRWTEKQSAAFDLLSKENDYRAKNLDLAKQLIDAQQNLNKATSEAGIQNLQAEADKAKLGLDLLQKIMGEEFLAPKALRGLLPEQQNAYQQYFNVLVKQLRANGANVSLPELQRIQELINSNNKFQQIRGAQDLTKLELSLIDARQAAEDKIAAKRLEALKTQQVFDQKSLEIELQKNKLQAQSNLFAAQRFETEQITSAQVAYAELDRAKRNGPTDPIQKAKAIADAQAKYDITKDGLKLAKDSVAQAERGVKQQAELSRLAVSAQKVQQGAALAQQQVTESARQEANERERSEKAVKGLFREQLKGIQAVNGGLQEQYAQQLFNQVIESGGDVRGNLYGILRDNKSNPYLSKIIQGGGYEDIVKAFEGTRNLNQFDSLSKQLQAQATGKDLITEMQKLGDRIEKVAAQPRNLTVQSNNPVRDAADIYSGISRNQARVANL